MNVNFITFRDLQGITGIGVMGGHIEVIEAGKIVRGIVNDLIYGSNGCPEFVDWTGNKVWNCNKGEWRMTSESYGCRSFSYSSLEHCWGPVEMKDGRILFIINNTWISLYPTSAADIPHRPDGATFSDLMEYFTKLRKELLDPDLC